MAASCWVELRGKSEIRAIFAGCGFAASQKWGRSPWGRRTVASIAVESPWRLTEPSTKHSFAHRLDLVNEMLTRFGEAAISGPALLCAVLAHGDVPWRRADPTIGQVLEVGLDEYTGRPCSNAWCALLSGEANLLPPTPPPERLQRQTKPSPVRIYRQGPDGEMRPIGEHESLWR